MLVNSNLKKIKFIIIMISAFIFSSCGTGLKISKVDYKKMDINFSGTFMDSSFKAKARTAIPGVSSYSSSKYRESISSLLMLHDVKKSQNDPIIFKLNANKYLEVTYIDSLKIQRTKVFHGKLSKRGYYEYFHFKERIEIPPLFPIIYGETHISRLRFGFSNNNLVIDNYRNSSGNIFIFAAGGSSREQHYFKPIN